MKNANKRYCMNKTRHCFFGTKLRNTILHEKKTGKHDYCKIAATYKTSKVTRHIKSTKILKHSVFKFKVKERKNLKMN